MNTLFPEDAFPAPPALIGGLIEGDCLNHLPRIADGSIDLAFVDPPFNIGYGYDVYDDRKSCDEYLDWCTAWGRELVRVLKPTGTLWLAIGDAFAAELKVIFHRTLGLHLRSWVVWYYTFGVNCPRKLTPSHTHLLHFTKDRTRFTFNADAAKVPSARQLDGDRRATPGGRLPDDTWVLRPKDAVDGGAFAPDHDVWSASRVNGTFNERVGWHSCQMPEAVLARVVALCSDPGDLVLDPMAGSGTTLAVAKKLGRRFTGFELSPDYARKAWQRVQGVNAGDPIAGGGVLAKPVRARRPVA